MTALEYDRPLGFSLRAAAEFYADFVPGRGVAEPRGDVLTLAFRMDGSFEPAVVALRERGDKLAIEVSGTIDVPAALRHATRMLALDTDGEAWQRLGQEEAVVGRLQREFPGFFCAAKPSAYDAAAWGVLCSRWSMPVAAKMKQALSRQCGDTITTNTGSYAIFPAPRALLGLSSFPGLPSVKLERLQALARAALDGKLDTERLRELPVDAALRELQQLPGVGPWTASHILFRGAALQDELPLAEPRVLRGLELAYGLSLATFETLQEHAERWRPFRTWVCVLLARHLARQGGWEAPGLAEQRATAGRGLLRSLARG